jgi:hypothetical protein
LACLLDIYRRVYVSVVMDATRWTVPFPDGQRQFIQQMPTRRTQLRRRKESIQRQVCPAAPGSLVFQFTEYLPERRIRDVFGKIVILYHPYYVQSFDIDRLVLADDLRREFLKRIPSGIADFGVQSGYSESGFLSIITVLDLSRQTALKCPQSLL